MAPQFLKISKDEGLHWRTIAGAIIVNVKYSYSGSKFRRSGSNIPIPVKIFLFRFKYSYSSSNIPIPVQIQAFRHCTLVAVGFISMFALASAVVMLHSPDRGKKTDDRYDEHFGEGVREWGPKNILTQK